MTSSDMPGGGRGDGASGEFLLGFDMPLLLPQKISTPRNLARVKGSKRAKKSVPQVEPSGEQVVQSLETGGEPVETDENQKEVILSVSELTRRISHLLEGGIAPLWVEGELSNVRRQSSGHCYFTLKDQGSQLSCVLFARSLSQLDSMELRDGQQVCLFGQIGVYQPRGQYQLMVRLVRPKGEGVLQARFEALKRRLAAEGLFDQARKREMPPFPRRIGVVTSPTGAAIHDFLQVLHRRNPGLRVVINPVRVQGKGAAMEIAAAIGEFSKGSEVIGRVEVIVLTRGGGSLEDLWEFNEEVVARAIADSAIPVVSAVGHEIDFSIADFVADLRAPTPSAAAELLAAEGSEVMERCNSLVRRIGREATALLERYNDKTLLLAESSLFREPLRRVDEARQTLDRQEEDLTGAMLLRLERLRSALFRYEALLAGSHPRHVLASARQRMRSLSEWTNALMTQRFESMRGRLDRVAAALSALNPEATLLRGFSITRTLDGRVITSASQVTEGSKISTQFLVGEVISQIVPLSNKNTLYNIQVD